MKILITGGAGFIGSNLSERLLLEGHEVYCMDNFFSSARVNIEHMEGNPLFHVIEHDVTSPIRLNHHVDHIYNLACPASPLWYQKDPVKTVRTNVEGAINILEFARDTGARVLQASTSEICGDPTEHPQKESYRGNVNILGPRACYDEGKRLAETIFMDYHYQYKVNIRIARIFNTYGPRMALDDGRVVSNFITQALKGQPITIYGDGTQTRSFQYVSNLIEGMVSLMNAADIFEPVNIGNPDEFTINDLAEKILRITKSKSSTIHKALPQDDPRQRCPDITLAKKILRWSPTVSLDDGLPKTIRYFKEVLDQI